MSKRFSPKFKAAALALLDAGVTTREAQAQLRKRFREHVGEGTLRSWLKARDAAPPESEPAPEAPESEDAVGRSGGPTSPAAETAEETLDTYERVTRRRARVEKLADEAEQVGNLTAAQRFSKQVVDLDLLLARLDRERKVGTDVVTIPRADLERIRQAMRDRVAALASDLRRTGGIVCSSCGRSIRVALAKGEQEEPE